MSLAVGLKNPQSGSRPHGSSEDYSALPISLLWGVNKTNAVVVQMLRIYRKRSLDIPWSSFE